MILTRQSLSNALGILAAVVLVAVAIAIAIATELGGAVHLQPGVTSRSEQGQRGAPEQRGALPPHFLSSADRSEAAPGDGNWLACGLPGWWLAGPG